MATPWQQNNRERFLAQKRAYRLLHRDEINAKKRAWHAANKVDQNVKSLAYFNDHHDELLAKNREYKVEHRPEMNGYQNTFRINEREEGGRIHTFRTWLDALKIDPCSDCGNTFPTCAMDFDHVRGEKLFNVGNVRGLLDSPRARERALEEIAKCDLVCANCHRVRTRDRDRLERKTLAVKGDAS